jgi:hypothetical protein
MKLLLVDPTKIRFEFSVARFVARWADVGLFFLLIRLQLRPLGLARWPVHYDWFLALVVSILVSSVSMSLFGTTLWKSALGLRVERYDGGTPRLWQSLKRELLVTALGMGCGIPILAVPAGMLWGWRVMLGKRSFWNWKLGLISVRTNFLERLMKRRSGRMAAVAMALLLMIEAWLILFRAARYDTGWIIIGF